MFIAHPEGGKELIYEIEVSTYPDGIVYNYESESFLERPVCRLKKDWWVRPEPDFDFKRERRLEKNRQAYDKEYVDPKIQAYRSQEWDRRLNGFWFYNKGKPTFITGLHYFYLTHWKIDIGYPSYRDADRKYFYLLQWVIDNPDCFGLIEVSQRRSGKSYKSQAFLYECPSRTAEAHGGIQSKSDDDAAKYYNKLISAFKKLPDFFIPEYNKRSTKGGLYFQKHFSPEEEYDEEKELNSDVTYASSSASSFDSSKLHRYVRDEVFKPIEGGKKLDIIEAWQVVKPTLMLGTKNIIGKAIFTSTVEEGASEQGKRLWDMSDWNKRSENNRTESGLVRIFLPVYQNDESHIDKYGFCDEKASKEYELREREALKNNPRALLSQMRKRPFTIQEAFYEDPGKTPFDVKAINDQISYLHQFEIIQQDLYTQGDFQWKDGQKDTKVVFVPNSNGKFLLHNKVTQDLVWNSVKYSAGNPVPLNEHSIVAGCDPFDHKSVEVQDKYRMSNGAGYVFHKHDGLNEELSETFICEYIYRQPDPEDFFEDMLKMCFYFGCRILIENNKKGVIDHFERRGYNTWMVKPKGSNTRGIPATQANKGQLVEVTTSYISHNCKKVVFPRLLNDWLKFDVENSTANDASMAAGWALVAAYRADKKVTKEKKAISKQVWSMQLLSQF